MTTESGAKMAAFECPICAPKRYFVTEIGLRTHVADRHPWRSLPPAQTRIPVAKAVLADPAWLREQQASAAAAVSVYSPHLPPPPHLTASIGGRFGPANNPPHQNVTFDTQSLLSDEVFFENDLGRGRYQQQQMQQQRMKMQQQQPSDPFADEAPTTIRHPPPDYDPPSPIELSRSLDAVDSIPRKKRDLATARRPWYDSTDYEGPRNVMEQPGGYYRFDDDDQTGRNPDPEAASYLRGRMRRELDDRDSRIETLRMEIDRLWDERMRLLKQEAERSRAVKEQQQLQLQGRVGGPAMPTHGYWDAGFSTAMPATALQGGVDGLTISSGRRRNPQVDPYSNTGGHAFHPVAPHSRLQLYRTQDQQNQQLQYQLGRRAIDY